MLLKYKFHLFYLVVIGVLVFLVSYKWEASTETEIKKLETEIDSIQDSIAVRMERKEKLKKKREKIRIKRYNDVEPDSRMDTIRSLLNR